VPVCRYIGIAKLSLTEAIRTLEFYQTVKNGVLHLDLQHEGIPDGQVRVIVEDVEPEQPQPNPDTAFWDNTLKP